ncbi:DUF6056 family protein [Tessaracoccus sp. MC1756]|uniref:DUF6056 family protein n=1 Tax=Tessaracoccus sp. MC1756 TaxID=2760311 RepID=UPI0016004A52|nr:DUF6056 family protein [Tessaracoccus sp. MC1756]MBB1510684.1 hypothetical protein [Tessaracoccus sp. MC1756]
MATEPTLVRRGRFEPATWTIAGLAVLSYLAWWWLFRSWFLAGDDYAFLAEPGRPYGQFTAQYWWDSLVDDWGRRNGRVSDAVLRLLLRPGIWFFPLFAPAMLTGTGLALGWAASRGRPPGAPRAWIYAAGLGTISGVCWLVPGIFGDGIFWAAGGVNYVAPLGMLAVCIAVYAHLLRGGRMGWPFVLAAALLVALTDAMQEVSSGAGMILAVGVVLVAGFRLSAKLWVLVGAAMISFAVHMSSPGLWNRTGQVVQDSPLAEQILHGSAVSSSMLLSRSWPLWFALVALLAVAAVHPSTGRRATVWLSSAAYAAGAFFAVAAAYRVRVPSLATAEFPERYTWLVVLLFVLMIATVALVGLALLAGTSLLGTPAVLAWAAFAGSCIFVFASGVANTRVHLVPLCLLALTVLSCLAAIVVTRQRSKYLAVLTAAALLVPSAVWFDATRRGLGQNERFVANRIVAPIEAARDASGPTEVRIPYKLPRPDLTYPRAFVSGYLRTLHVYYDLPDNVTLVPEEG